MADEVENETQKDSEPQETSASRRKAARENLKFYVKELKRRYLASKRLTNEIRSATKEKAAIAAFEAQEREELKLCIKAAELYCKATGLLDGSERVKDEPSKKGWLMGDPWNGTER